MVKLNNLFTENIEQMEMKVCFVSPEYYPNLGGVSSLVQSMAEALAAAGITVIVLSQF